MDIFKINFKLQEIDKVLLWGEKPNQSIHWFGLTDGLLWIDVGNHTIYEYSDYAQRYFDNHSKYNDYQISRFLEDFSYLFDYIGESIPLYLYDNIQNFENITDQWKNIHINEPDELFDDFYFNNYSELTEWFFQEHTMDSGHLIGGPHISFFRYNNKLKIMWSSNGKLENENNIWSSPTGIIEIPYNLFVDKVSEFFEEFFIAMDKQVQNAINKNWGSVYLDKEKLIIENTDRKNLFNQKLSLLSNTQANTDWSNIQRLYEKMLFELDNI